MPNYEYLCKKCGHRFEQIRKFSDRQLRKCPECGGVIEQVISAPAVQFKGSGWYVNDYAKKGAAPARRRFVCFFRRRQRSAELRRRKTPKTRRAQRLQERRQAQVRRLAQETQEGLNHRAIWSSGHRAIKNRTDFSTTRFPDYAIPPFRSGRPTTRVRRRGSSSSEISARNCRSRPSRSHS